MSTHSERARQWVHVGSSVFALLLRGLTWPQAALLAVAALAFNAFVLPRLGGRQLYRPADHARGFPVGILLYPVAVLLLILFFRTRRDLVAAAWGILAFGDGMATLVGHRVRGARLRWNGDKSVAGTLAFLVCGGAAGMAFALWVRPAIAPPPSLAFAIIAPLAAAVAAALVESIPVRLDDNISVPVAAAVVLWAASHLDATAWSASRAAVIASLPLAIAFNVVVAYLGFRAKTVSISGMIGGAVVGIVIYACGGAGAWALLFLTFAAATISSRAGLARKTRLGIAEEKGGRRGAGNAFANCGVAALASVLAVATPWRAEALLALTAALVAGGSDTVASEIGKAWGRRTFLVTSLARVAPGTPGAVSLEGTLAGLASAAVLAAIAIALGLVGGRMIVAVIVAATAGALVESALGATLEGPGILNNDMLNFINTGVAAVTVLWLA
ncbi:MAG TPA: DUF92 domain-containing protein [Vicinamibacterales bacterium]|nr:DUF92 domain-containing protein [Vicinamibacterales bacterium]